MGTCYSNTANRNEKNGIRFGIISLNKISQEPLGEFMMPDIPPICGDCSTELIEIEGEWYCKSCDAIIHNPEYCDEGYDGPLFYKDEEYELQLSRGEIWVLNSPYKTLGSHCSPCAPGAITLEKVGDNYGLCLGEEWFDEYNPMPYKIEKVEV